MILAASLVAAALALLFGWLAFFKMRVMFLHLLATWVFLVGIPLVASTSWVGRRGGSLVGTEIAAGLVSSSYLYLFYVLGAAAIAWWFRADLVDRIRSTLQHQEFGLVWLGYFIAALGVEAVIRWQFGFFVSGSMTGEAVLSMPYIYSSIYFLMRTVSYGMFCYAALTSRKSYVALGLCAVFLSYLLVVEGRRYFIMSIIVMLMLRNAAMWFPLGKRFAISALAGLVLFLFVGPFFVAARERTLNQQYAGASQIESLVEGLKEAVDSFDGSTASLFETMSDKIAMRGSAGVFFLSTVARLAETQGGEVLKVSLQWAVPSVISGGKPELAPETMIQLAANMEVFDDAPSVPVIFYTDFGPFGVLLGGAYMAAVLYVIASRLATGRHFGLFEIALLGAFFQLSFMVETEMLTQFGHFRNLAIIYLGTFWLGRGRRIDALRWPHTAVAQTR